MPPVGPVALHCVEIVEADEQQEVPGGAAAIVGRRGDVEVKDFGDLPEHLPRMPSDRFSIVVAAVGALQLDGDNAMDIRGSEVRMWCKQETGLDGQARERWSISRPRETRPVTPVATSDASRIDAMFGDAFGSTEQAAPQQVGERVTPLNL